jgi:hypothetical protein
VCEAPALPKRRIRGATARFLDDNITIYLRYLRGGRVTCQRLVHDSHSSFCEEVLSRRPAPAAARMRWSGQIFWLLASGKVKSFCLSVLALDCLRPSSRLHRRPAAAGLTIGSWEVVSSYSSATAPGFHGISRADPLINPETFRGQTRKELPPEVAACGSLLKNYLSASAKLLRCGIESPQPSRHRRRRIHWLESGPRLAGKISRRAADGD